jgi:hypothetical protein
VASENGHDRDYHCGCDRGCCHRLHGCVRDFYLRDYARVLVNSKKLKKFYAQIIGDIITVEEQKANQIHKEANTANNKNELRVMNLFNFNESEILKSI